MKLNNGRNQQNRGFIPSDFLRFMSENQLLHHLISKSVAEAFDEFIIDCKIEEKSPKTILFYRDRLKWFIDFIKPSTLLPEISPA